MSPNAPENQPAHSGVAARSSPISAPDRLAPAANRSGRSMAKRIAPQPPIDSPATARACPARIRAPGAVDMGQEVGQEGRLHRAQPARVGIVDVPAIAHARHDHQHRRHRAGGDQAIHGRGEPAAVRASRARSRHGRAAGRGQDSAGRWRRSRPAGRACRGWRARAPALGADRPRRTSPAIAAVHPGQQQQGQRQDPEHGASLVAAVAELGQAVGQVVAEQRHAQEIVGRAAGCARGEPRAPPRPIPPW